MWKRCQLKNSARWQSNWMTRTGQNIGDLLLLCDGLGRVLHHFLDLVDGEHLVGFFQRFGAEFEAIQYLETRQYFNTLATIKLIIVIKGCTLNTLGQWEFEPSQVVRMGLHQLSVKLRLTYNRLMYFLLFWSSFYQAKRDIFHLGCVLPSNFEFASNWD